MLCAGAENAAISDAMRMRGIRFGGKRPGKMVEYRLIPLMISVVNNEDELSVAALTRGLGAPVKRTDICKIGFHWQDVVMILICQCCTDILHLESGHIAACYPMDAAGVSRIRDFFRIS